MRFQISLFVTIFFVSLASAVDTKLASNQESIESVLNKHRQEIMALPGVIGAGISRCGSELCIKVLVVERSEKLEQQLRMLTEPFPCTIERSDTIEALPDNR